MTAVHENLTMTDLTKSMEKQYEDLSERFKTHYETVIKPTLPKELTDLVEQQSDAINVQVKAKAENTVVDYESVETYEAMKKALEMLRAVCGIYGVK